MLLHLKALYQLLITNDMNFDIFIYFIHEGFLYLCFFEVDEAEFNNKKSESLVFGLFGYVATETTTTTQP